MRRQRRWPMVLCVLLGTAVFLLMLSALVEAPPAAEAPAPQYAPVAEAVLLPAATLAPEAATTARSALAMLALIACLWLIGLLLPRLTVCRDANGRVLCARSYARSYHPVFRRELVCG